MADLNGNGIDDALEYYMGIMNAGAGAQTNFGQSIVKVPTVGSMTVPGGRTEASATPYFRPATVDQAVLNFVGDYSRGGEAGKLIVNSMVQAGLVRPNANIEQLESAYKSALTMTAKMNVTNPKATLFDAMSLLGTGSGGGSGQGGTYKEFVKFTDQQLKDKAVSSYNAILGRPPTAEEEVAFAKAMRAGAKAAPGIRKVSGSGKLAETQQGFDENAFIAGYMSNKIPEQATELDGMAGQIQDLIDNYRENYGVKPSVGFVNNAIKTVIGSKDRQTAQDNLEQQLKEQAQIMFPALKEKIDAGLSVRAIADPFISAYSKIMEENDMNVKLDNKDVIAALSAKNEKGEYQIPTLDDFARGLRSKTEWLDTRNAKETMLGAADSILRQFNFRR